MFSEDAKCLLTEMAAAPRVQDDAPGFIGIVGEVIHCVSSKIEWGRRKRAGGVPAEANCRVSASQLNLCGSVTYEFC